MKLDWTTDFRDFVALLNELDVRYFGAADRRRALHFR
jgi:hypothetical protein